MKQTGVFNTLGSIALEELDKTTMYLGKEIQSAGCEAGLISAEPRRSAGLRDGAMHRAQRLLFGTDL
jgi:hypothetical protein